MKGRRWLPMVLVTCAGCISDEMTTMLVPADHFTQRAIQRERVAFAPAAVETAARVEAVGMKLLAANPQMGLRPVFRTIGAPQPEIFHVGTEELNLTEGLVNQCKTEGQLAAVVAHELGIMLAEREAITWPHGRSPEREPPSQMRVGNDHVGAGATPDLTHMAELGKYEKAGGSPRPTAARPPDPRAVAKGLLVRAGFAETELNGVSELLASAATSLSFEMQFRANSANQR